MKLTPERQAAFCAALAATGIVKRACQAVDIARQTAYEWRDEDPEFAAEWDRALRIGIGELEDEAHRRAFEGVDEPLTHQGKFTYTRVNGKRQLATIKKYSDTLAIFLLKAHDPKYREQSRVDLTNSDGTMAPVDDTTRLSRLAHLMAKAKARMEAGEEPQADDAG